MPTPPLPKNGFKKKYAAGLKRNLRTKLTADQQQIITDPTLSLQEKKAAVTIIRIMRKRGLKAINEGARSTRP